MTTWQETTRGKPFIMDEGIWIWGTGPLHFCMTPMRWSHAFSRPPPHWWYHYFTSTVNQCLIYEVLYIYHVIFLCIYTCKLDILCHSSVMIIMTLWPVIQYENKMEKLYAESDLNYCSLSQRDPQFHEPSWDGLTFPPPQIHSHPPIINDCPYKKDMLWFLALPTWMLMPGNLV